MHIKSAILIIYYTDKLPRKFSDWNIYDSVMDICEAKIRKYKRNYIILQQPKIILFFFELKDSSCKEQLK